MSRGSVKEAEDPGHKAPDTHGRSALYHVSCVLRSASCVSCNFPRGAGFWVHHNSPMKTSLFLTFVTGLLLGSGPTFGTAVTCLTLLGLAAIMSADYGRECLLPVRAARH